MKQFLRALDTQRPYFKYLCNKFPSLSYDKVKSGIFVGPQIRKLMLDSDFENVMCDFEINAWNSFRMVVNNFLGNYKDPNYN